MAIRKQKISAADVAELCATPKYDFPNLLRVMII